MISGQYSQVVKLSGGISSGSSHQQNSTWRRTVFTPSLAVVVRQRWDRSPTKSKARRTSEGSSMRWDWKLGKADHIWKEKGNHLPLWDKVEIIDRAEHWRIRRLKESAHMLGYYNDLLSRSSIELNTILEPIIKKARWEKKSEFEHR